MFLGIDVGFFEDEHPLIFETMVFPSEKDPREIECKRYSTEAEAIEGHRHIVEKYSK